MCINFGSDYQKPDILLKVKVRHWESKDKHVGNVLNPSLHDIDDIKLKWPEFFQQVKIVKVFNGTFLYSYSLNTVIHFMEEICGKLGRTK